MNKIDHQIGVGCAQVSENEKKYVNEALNNNRLSYGPFLRKFEAEMASAHQAKHAISCNSGTDALRIAIATLKETEGWQDGDEVLVPAVTFIATSNIVLQNNLKPVFVDVDPKIYNMDPAKIEEKITSRTKAILVVHLFGLSAEMDPIMEIARNHNLKVVEDACESMFAKYKGKSVGTFGSMGCFSSYVAHLIVTGVGGVTITNNDDHAIILRSLVNHGRDGIYLSIDDDKTDDKEKLSMIASRRFRFERVGYSARITELEGALGVGQLEIKDEILKKRQKNAQYLIDNLKHLEEFIQLPSWPDYSEHSFMMFPIVIKDDKYKKEDLVNFLEENNIETRDMLPLLNQPVYKKIFGDIEDDYPVAKWINNNGFYIGCHQVLTKEELDYVTAKINEFFKPNKSFFLSSSNMKRKKALITGVTGQDGSYLADFLLKKGYEVHGIIRRSSSFNTERVMHIFQEPFEEDRIFFLHYGDLSDSSSLSRLMDKIAPDEIYHIGAQSHVRVSFDIPEYTADVTGIGTLRILDAIKETGIKTKFYQASSSEMFGRVREVPQNEQTPFYPRSPYACSKVFAYWATVNYRESYNLFACNGILFNHESPRRGETFVTRKITRALAKILAGKQDKLYLGNLDAKRDWGYAPDYIEAMWLILQQDQPDDYVVATGETHSIREFLDEAFGLVGLDWNKYVGIDPKYYRPAEVDLLLGDASKAKEKLGWEPRTNFKDLVRIMVEADIKKEGLDPATHIVQ